ncbi:MAG TPA: nuclear transport factor 2 family protein [Dehalococcoidia bacterium]|nr:nuclear transport factor 2 family protein [Dehalococcoidia bacterium]
MRAGLDATSFEAWLAAYGRAWEEQDADGAAALFSADATYQEVPFDEPMRGREAIGAYWSEGTAAQEGVKFGAEVIAVSGDVGVARWRASFVRSASGARVRLDGIFLVRMESDGRCTQFQEWWHREEKPPS